MAKGREVLHFLRPDGGWFIEGDTFEGITFLECEPLTKKEYDDAFANFDSLMEKEETKKTLAKAALLDRLGLTDDEFKTLIS